MSAVALEGASSLMKQHSFRKILSHRKQIDIPTYEKLILASAQADLNNTEVCKPELWNIQNPILYLGTRDHKRQYTTSSSS